MRVGVDLPAPSRRSARKSGATGPNRRTGTGDGRAEAVFRGPGPSCSRRQIARDRRAQVRASAPRVSREGNRRYLARPIKTRTPGWSAARAGARHSPGKPLGVVSLRCLPEQNAVASILARPQGRKSLFCPPACGSINSDPMNSFRVTGPDAALAAFEREAASEGLTTSRAPMVAPGADPAAAAQFLELVFSGSGVAVAAVLARVVRAYLAAGPARRFTLAANQDGRMVSLDARGYSADELTRILPVCQSAIAHEAKSVPDTRHG